MVTIKGKTGMGKTGNGIIDAHDAGMATLARDILALSNADRVASPRATSGPITRDAGKRDTIEPYYRIDGTAGDDILSEFISDATGEAISENNELYGYGGDDRFIMLLDPFRVTPDTGAGLGARDPLVDYVDGGAGVDTLQFRTAFGRTDFEDVLSFRADPNGGYTGLLTQRGFSTEINPDPIRDGTYRAFVDFDRIEQFDITIERGALVSTRAERVQDPNLPLTLGDGDDRVTFLGFNSTEPGGGGVNRPREARMGAGNDTLTFSIAGSNGASTLTGSLADGYSGTFGSDAAGVSFTGAENFDMTWDDLASTVTVGDGNNVVRLGGGDDRLTVGTGINVVDGGAGTDLLNGDFSRRSTGVAIDLRVAGEQQSGGTGSVTGFEGFIGTITGSGFGDRFAETPAVASATYNTGDGDDEVTVSSGTDTVNMGAGNDRLVLAFGGATNSVQVLNQMNGTLTDGYSGGFYIVDNSARTSFTGVENFTITSSAYNDAYTTGDGEDVLSSGAGNDVIQAGGGTNAVDGGADIDALGIDLSGQSTGVTINLLRTGAQQTRGAGSVTGFESFAGAVTGSAFGDTLIEGVYAFDATFDTGAGNDLVQVSRGNDTAGLGAGNDRLVLDYGTATNAVQVLAALTGTLANGYSGAFYIVDNSARTSFSAVENFTITSGGFADSFTTGDGNDVLSSGEANDVIQAGGGTNAVDGGAGIDALGIDLSGQATGVTIDLFRTEAQQTRGAGSVAGFESFAGAVKGSAFADVLIETTQAFDAVFDAGAGADVVQVSRGSDTVNMGSDNDRLVLDYSTAGSNVAILNALSGTLAEGYSGGFLINDNTARTSFTGVENFTITSGNLADTLTTGDGNDDLSTGGGNDVVAAGGGNNTVNGGLGIDALGIDLSGQTQGVTIDLLRTGAQQIGGTGSVTEFESFAGAVRGSAFGDTLIEGVEAFSATFHTGAGNDLVQVSRGNDTVNMDAGSDRLVVDYGSATNVVQVLATLTGTLADGYSGGFYIADNSARTSFSGVENFTITSGGFADSFTTADGNDVLSSGGGNDVVQAGGGTNVVDGGAGVDALGIDLSGQSRGVTIDLLRTGAQQTGGAGSVTGFESFAGTVGGSRFADTLIEGVQAFSATFDTGAGNDLVQVARGNDTVNMGIGNDRLVLDYSTAANVVSALATLTGSLADGYAGGFYIADNSARTSFTGVENFTITSGAFADTIVTGGGADIVSGGAGNDTLTAAGGNDVLNGDAGDDRLNGGAGIDTASYSGATAGVTVSLAIAVAQVTGEGSDTLTGIENLTGSAFADMLSGDANANALIGAAGDDVLDGRAGGDRMSGGLGGDTYRVENTLDRVIELAGEGYDTVFASVTYRVADNVEAVVLTGDAAISAIGNGMDDMITGNDSANTLRGRAGNDTLVGNGGDDTLDGGQGADSMTGGGGNDTFIVNDAGDIVVELAGGGVDTVRATLDYILADAAENLVLLGSARSGTGNALENRITGTESNNILSGLGGRDTLLGGAGNDILSGGDDNDILTGGAGRDTMTGGTGADRFYFADGDFGATTSRADVITDFSHAQSDRINLTATDAIVTTEGVDGFWFVGTAAFSGASGELRYVIAQGDTLIQADTDGDKVADLIVRLTGSHTLVAGDFVGVSAALPFAGEDPTAVDDGSWSGSNFDAMWMSSAGAHEFGSTDLF